MIATVGLIGGAAKSIASGFKSLFGGKEGRPIETEVAERVAFLRSIGTSEEEFAVLLSKTNPEQRKYFPAKLWSAETVEGLQLQQATASAGISLKEAERAITTSPTAALTSGNVANIGSGILPSIIVAVFAITMFMILAKGGK